MSKKWKIVRRAFRKKDTERKSQLSVEDFKQVLLMSGVYIDEAMFHTL